LGVALLPVVRSRVNLRGKIVEEDMLAKARDEGEKNERGERKA
jgi:hypothetical protein